MTKNRFLEAIKAGECPVQAWMWNPSVLFAEIVSCAGYDSVSLDLQHGAIDFSDLYSMFSVISSRRATPMVRIPANEPGWISRVLDGGAYGVICPDVRSATEAKVFASACKYAPEGERGFGPIRPVLPAPGAEGLAAPVYDVKAENQAVMAIVQIESPDGLENVEAIVGTEGIDGVFPGLVDYSLLAFGEVVTDFRDPRLRDPLERIIEAAHSAGKPVGLPVITPDQVPFLLEIGADWLQVGSDVAWVTAGARQSLADTRKAIVKAHSNK